MKRSWVVASDTHHARVCSMAGPPSTIVTDGNMIAVATRIKEQARKLFDEQNILRVAKSRLDHALEVEHRESAADFTQRRTLLESTIARNQVEMELLERRDTLGGSRASIRCLRAQTANSSEEYNKIRLRYMQDVESSYAPHEADMALYNTALSAAVESLAKEAKTDEARLRCLESQTQRLRSRRDVLKSEFQAFLEDSDRLVRVDRDGAICVFDLATQVRQSLCKRTEMRRAIRYSKYKRNEVENDLRN